MMSFDHSLIGSAHMSIIVFKYAYKSPHVRDTQSPTLNSACIQVLYASQIITKLESRFVNASLIKTCHTVLVFVFPVFLQGRTSWCVTLLEITTVHGALKGPPPRSRHICSTKQCLVPPIRDFRVVKPQEYPRSFRSGDQKCPLNF